MASASSRIPTDCLVDILAFGGEPLHAMVCKNWHQASRKSYQEIFSAYIQDPDIFQRISSDAICRVVKALNQEAEPSAACAQGVQEAYFSVMRPARVAGIQASKETPLNLVPVLRQTEREEDGSLITIFTRIVIPGGMPHFEGGRSTVVAGMRRWMQENADWIGSLYWKNLSLQRLGLKILPKEMRLFKSCGVLDIRHNKLAFRPAVLKHINVEHLRFEGNPFVETERKARSEERKSK